jgi:hypothetical protein
MSKAPKASTVAVPPTNEAALKVVQWLRSHEGREHSRQTFQKTEKMLAEFHDRQIVDPKSLQRPVTL